MEEYVKHILEEKATEVSICLDSAGFFHRYRLVDYGINFTLWQGGNRHTLTLSYSSNKKCWKPRSANEWVNDVVIPSIQPLLGGKQPQISQQQAKTTSNGPKTFSAEIYFADARKHLHMLVPFARDNIDFSVICDFAQRGVRLTLNDPRLTFLDRQALEIMLEQPHQIDFNAAKEYLHQCLMVCGVTGN